MRYRQANKSDAGGDARVKALIRNNDVLSTREQEDVIRYFAKSMKSTNRFVLVIAGLHVLLAIVFLILLFSGSPLVSSFQDGAQRQAYENMLEHAKGLRAQKEALDRGELSTSMDDAPTAADPLRELEKQRRATDEKQVVDYLGRRAGGGGADTASLSVTSALAMLCSATLLLAGGYGCFKAFLAMRFDTNSLVDSEPQDITSGTGPSAAGSSDFRSPPESDDRDWRDEQKRLMTSCPASARPRFQYVIGALSTLPSTYWALSSWAATRQMNALYREVLSAGVSPDAFRESTGAVASVTDNVLGIILMLWEPVFHVCIGYVLKSLYDGRAQLYTLSRLKYGFEKI